VAKVIAVRALDDLDRAQGIITDADETVTLAFNGREVELDLTTAHKEELAGLLAPYFKAVSRTLGGELPMTGSLSSRRSFKRDVRNWAREHGWPNLEPGGYIPKAATLAYLAAHPHLTPPDG
jgi:hypothetical protein